MEETRKSIVMKTKQDWDNFPVCCRPSDRSIRFSNIEFIAALKRVRGYGRIMVDWGGTGQWGDGVQLVQVYNSL